MMQFPYGYSQMGMQPYGNAGSAAGEFSGSHGLYEASLGVSGASGIYPMYDQQQMMMQFPYGYSQMGMQPYGNTGSNGTLGGTGAEFGGAAAGYFEGWQDPVASNAAMGLTPMGMQVGPMSLPLSVAIPSTLMSGIASHHMPQVRGLEG